MMLLSNWIIYLIVCIIIVQQQQYDSSCMAIRIRKNVKDLTAEEKETYIQGVLLLKETPSPWHPEEDNINYYDALVLLHQQVTQEEDENSDIHLAHGTPLFLSLHRKLLLMFEDGLNEVLERSDVGVPYWEWTDDISTDATFSDDFMGQHGNKDDCYVVNTGPFSKDQFVVNIYSYNQQDRSPWNYLVRGYSDISAAEEMKIIYPTCNDIITILNTKIFDCEPYSDMSPLNCSFRNQLEGYEPLNHLNQHMHNAVHWYTGGKFYCNNDESQMYQGQGATLDVSPNDPVFYQLHSYVDFLWDRWQKEGNNLGVWEPVQSDIIGMNMDDEMYPYYLYDEEHVNRHGKSSRSMLFSSNLGYKYQCNSICNDIC